LTSENEQLKQQLEKLRKDVDAQKALAQTHSEDANHLRKTISFLDDKFASEQKKLFSSNIKNEKIKKELIQLHKNLGHIKDARKLQKRRDSAMYYNLGISYIWSKRYQLAENALKKAVQLADDNADAWYNLALLYEEALDKPKDAKICYEKYLQLIPNSGETYDIQWRIMALE
jgi:tetratricopeptide (TPR) repeat protein